METLSQEEIAFNRKQAIDVLRLNPFAHKQIMHNLTDGNEGYCAVGEIGEALHVSPKLYGDRTYGEIERRLGLTESSGFIFRWNDTGYTFAEIASKLAKKWNME